MDFLLASGNQHKAQEFNDMAKGTSISISSASEKIQVIEDGESFHENAFKKADAYFKVNKRPIISDDSGIVVEALAQELGIHSARFGGEGLSDKQRCELLLEKMKDEENRSAYFVCVLCFYINPEKIFYFEGRMNGFIAHCYVGDNGFGYDPIFIPQAYRDQEKVVSLLADWKKENSHRGSAFKMAADFFHGHCQSSNS